MALRYLIDENLRGTLAVALVRYATRLGLELDVVQVGDDECPPLGATDNQILRWAETNQRILISQDRSTLPRELSEHLGDGHQLPGIFVVRNTRLMDIAEFLLLLAFASEREEWENKITFVP